MTSAAGFCPLVTRQDRVAGLTVVSASGTYYHFESRRDSEDDIIDRDPNRLVSTLQKQYYRS